LATLPNVVARGLAIDGDTIFVEAAGTLFAVPRLGGAPRELAKGFYGKLAARESVAYTFRFDAAAKQDQLVAINASGVVSVIATWSRTKDVSEVGTLALDSEGKLVVPSPAGVARIDPSTKDLQVLSFRKSGRPATLFAILNEPAVRGEQIAFARAGLGSRAGGELTGPELQGPIAFIGHSIVGVNAERPTKWDDIAGKDPATVVQVSTTSDKRRVLRKTALFLGAIVADDACAYVLNAARGEPEWVEAYALAPL
jgi:hypothetical protein